MLSRQISEISLEERKILFEEALKLKGKLSSYQIGKKIGIKPRTIRRWIYEGANPLSSFNYGNLEASSELAYVIGVMIGDGNLYHSRSRNYGLILSVKDRDFAEEFNKNVCKVLGKEELYSIGKDQGKFRVWASSKRLYAFLIEKNTFAHNVVEAHPSDFIRGFFDSEGNVYHYYTKRKGRMYFTCGIEVSNTNYLYLSLIKELLNKYFEITSFIHIEQREGETVFNKSLGQTIISRKNCYGLHVCRQMGLLKYAEYIGFSIKRKQRVLDEIVEFINARGGPRKRGWKKHSKVEDSTIA